MSSSPKVNRQCYHSNMNDSGPNPFVTDIESETISNSNYRLVRWTGTHLQLTLMSIPVGSDIGLERHEDTDQFLRIEQGEGIVILMAEGQTEPTIVSVKDGSVILVPAKTWHNVINNGTNDLKIYSLYGPPHHKAGEIDEQRSEGDPDEE